MDFDDILALPDKATVPEVQGRIMKVYDPRRPTQNQDRAGIHPQTLVLQDDAGTNLELYIMRKENHFLPSAEGEVYHFRCTPGERDGTPLGLAMNRWKGDKEEMVCVQVDRQAHFYAVEQTPAQRKAYEDTKPVVGDLISFYVQIITGVEERLNGSEVGAAFLSHPECLTSAAATIFIEGCKQGMYRKTPAEPYKGSDFAAAAAKAKAAREDGEVANGREHPTPAETPPASSVSKEDMTDAELALMITSGFPGEQLKAVFDSLPFKPEYARIYDEIVPLLEKEGYARSSIDAAHDRCRGLLKKKVPTLTDGQLYKSLCCNFASFREQLANAPKPRVPDTAALDEDDAGLPSLD